MTGRTGSLYKATQKNRTEQQTNKTNKMNLPIEESAEDSKKNKTERNKMNLPIEEIALEDYPRYARRVDLREYVRKTGKSQDFLVKNSKFCARTSA
jgi:hypothetical protein